MLLIVLSCLGTWAHTHNCLIVFIAVGAPLVVLVIYTTSGTTGLKLKGFGITFHIKRKP
jgi:hypothetical protein